MTFLPVVISIVLLPGAAISFLQELPPHLSSELSAPEEERRLDAVITLGAYRSAAVVSALASALRDRSPRVRAAAATGLAAAAGPDSVPALAEALDREKKASVRKSLAHALGSVADRRSTPALLSALKDKEAEVRGAAAVGLGRYADPSAVPFLVEALTDRDAFVRARAAAALGTIANDSRPAVPALIKLLSSDENAEARRQAAHALGAIGDPAALSALEQTSQSEDPYLSQAAAEAIRRIKAASTASRLIDASDERE